MVVKLLLKDVDKLLLKFYNYIIILKQIDRSINSKILY